MEVKIGDLIENKYRIVRLLGEGGMGAVYEGENIRIHHRVAIKVLHPNIATNSAVVERFEREAKAAGKIGSEHIVSVYDLGDLSDGGRYMVMEYLDGENLSVRIHSSGRMTPAAIAPFLLQLLDGLGAAHGAGIVHRDLKPENIFLVRHKSGSDFVKIVDFGVSKFGGVSGAAELSMTRTGSVLGTPYYMSPEQAKGAKATDPRSDLYSLGVVLFECVTGQVPFQADTFNELMFKIALEEAPDPSSLVPGIDAAFCGIVKKAMARDPAQRFQTAAEFYEAIIAWMQANGLSTSAATRAAGSHQELAATEPPPLGSPLSASAPGAPDAHGVSGVGKGGSFTGSIPNVASSVDGMPVAQKRSKAVFFAIAAVLVGALVIGIFVSMGKKTSHDATAGTQPIATTSTPVATAAPPVTAAPTVAPVPTTPAIEAVDAAPKPSANVVADTRPIVRPTGGPGPIVRHQPTPTPTASPTSTKTQVKGRVINDTL